MDLAGVMLREISQKDKHYDITYMWNQKNQQTSEYNKSKFTDIEYKLVVTTGERGERSTNY